MYKIEITGSMLTFSKLPDAIRESGYYKPAYDDMEDARMCLMDAFRFLRDTVGGALLKLRPLELQYDCATAEIVEL